MSNTEDEVLLKDGLVDAFGSYHMGITAENVAENGRLQDQYKMNSHHPQLKALKQ